MKSLNLFILLLCFVVSGCTHNAQPMGKPLPELSYENLNPLTVAGGTVIIQQSFRPSPETVRLAARFPVAPDKLIERYASHRFATTGGVSKLVFDIQKARLHKVADEDNIVGFLSGAAEDFYKLDVFIAMTPIRADGQRAAPFTIKMSRQLFIPQNSTLAERDFRKFEMLEKMIQMIDASIIDTVQNKMTPEYF